MPQRRKPLTVAAIESAPRKVAPYMLSDAGTGLCLRVSPQGAKTFRYRIRSERKVITLGPWSKEKEAGKVTLAQAREWVEKLRDARKAQRLFDVEADLKLAIGGRPQADGAGQTVGTVVENFLRILDKQRKRPEEAREVFERDILGVIGHVPLQSLTKAHCRNVVERVVKRGATVYAAKVLGLLRQFTKYASNVEMDFINPIADLDGSYLGVEKNIRDRWLTEEEIVAFWFALDVAEPAGVDASLEGKERRNAEARASLERAKAEERRRTAAALRLLLLTAVRTQELRLAQWDHVDMKAGTWTIPVANQKLTLKQARTARPFVVPLSPTAIELLTTLKKMAGHSRWVLASPASKGGHYTEKALSKAMQRIWRRDAKLKALAPATPHDLRRTARTWIGKLGTFPDVAERCLNHALRDMARVYDQGDYLPERRAALEKWDAFVQRLVSPEESKVAFLPTAS